jgi:hypothetical protein
MQSQSIHPKEQNFLLASDQLFDYRIFGVSIQSNYQLSIPTTVIQSSPEIEFIVSALPRRRDTNWRLVYSSPYRDANGINHFRLYTDENTPLLRLSSGIEFEFTRSQILCFSRDIPHPGIESGLLGPALAFWLENENITALHASAVEVNKRSIVFLSSSLSGKSSLAACFMQAGFTMLSDDIVPVESVQKSYIARSGYPSMRLWPDEAEFFLGGRQGLKPENPKSRKLRISVGPDGFGRFTHEAKPVGCIYLPERYSPSESYQEIVISPISMRDALIEFMRFSYVARLIEAIGLAPARLIRLGEMARVIPVRRLVFPNGYERLNSVRDALLSDIETGIASETPS